MEFPRGQADSEAAIGSRVDATRLIERLRSSGFTREEVQRWHDFYRDYIDVMRETRPDLINQAAVRRVEMLWWVLRRW